MARETEDGIQENNGAPMGQGQPGRKGFRAKAKQLKRKQMPPEVAGAVNPMMGNIPPVFQGQQPQTYPGAGFQTDAGRMGMPQEPQVNTGQQLQQPLGGLPSRERRDQLKYNAPLAGFNTSNDYGGDVKARNSLKNTWARAVQSWDQTPESFTPEELAQFMQTDLRKELFPQASLVEGGKGDLVDFGGMLSDYESGVPVFRSDVIGNAAPGQGTLTWQDLVNDAMGPAPGNAIYNQAQNQMGTEGGQQTAQMLESLDEGTLMELLRALMGEGQQEIF